MTRILHDASEHAVTADVEVCLRVLLDDDAAGFSRKRLSAALADELEEVVFINAPTAWGAVVRVVDVAFPSKRTAPR